MADEAWVVVVLTHLRDQRANCFEGLHPLFLGNVELAIIGCRNTTRARVHEGINPPAQSTVQRLSRDPAKLGCDIAPGVLLFL